MSFFLTVVACWINAAAEKKRAECEDQDWMSCNTEAVTTTCSATGPDGKREIRDSFSQKG